MSKPIVKDSNNSSKLPAIESVQKILALIQKAKEIIRDEIEISDILSDEECELIYILQNCLITAQYQANTLQKNLEEVNKEFP